MNLKTLKDGIRQAESLSNIRVSFVRQFRKRLANASCANSDRVRFYVKPAPFAIGAAIVKCLRCRLRAKLPGYSVVCMPLRLCILQITELAS